MIRVFIMDLGTDLTHDIILFFPAFVRLYGNLGHSWRQYLYALDVVAGSFMFQIRAVRVFPTLSCPRPLLPFSLSLLPGCGLRSQSPLGSLRRQTSLYPWCRE